MDTIYMLELILFAVSALFASGILFHHKRAFTYLACAGALFEMEMMLSAYIRRQFVHNIGGQTFYLLAGILLVALCASLYKHWKSPYITPGSGKRDGFVGIALIVVFALAYPIISANGYRGDNFVLHGFYNGDVVTFASLINKSFATIGLVQENPFSANGSLEYPTLLHGAFADFFSLTGIDSGWLRFLSIMTYAQILITIPMFFLLWDTVFPEPKNKSELWFGIVSRNTVYGLQVILTLIAVGLSLDSYVYPQSHFFLSAANDMIRAGLPYLFVLAAAVYALSRKQYLAISSILIGFLGVFTFFLADRNIVKENASRFLYHGFLIGFPLLAGHIITYLYFLRREIRLTSRPASEIISGWIGVIIILAILFMPFGISAGSTYSNLLKNDAHTISFNTQETLWWIDAHAKPLDVIIANPNEPFSVPLFTSKALLRTNDYWLSLQDTTTEAIVSAFAGDAASQQEVLAQGNYLLLTPEEQKTWDVSKLKKVFESPDSVVYWLK